MITQTFCENLMYLRLFAFELQENKETHVVENWFDVKKYISSYFFLGFPDH